MKIDSTNKKSRQKKPLWIFLHVPKTAGTTIRDHVEANFDEQQYSMLRTSKKLFSREEVFSYYCSLSEFEKDKLIFIGGHFAYYGIHKFFPNREIRYITFLREPIFRLISHYNHCFYLYLKGRRSPWTENFFRGGSKIFSSWLSDNQNEKSCFAFLLSRLLNKKARPESIFEDLEEVKKILGKFYFIGISDNVEDFELLYSLIGINKRISDQNVSKDFIDYGDKRYLDSRKDYEKIEKVVSKDCKDDLELYQFGLMFNKNFKCKRLD